MKMAGQLTAGSPAAFAACALLFAPTVFAQPVSGSLGELLVGKAAFGDWRTDAPLVRRKITELPPPYATQSASNPPRVVAKPVSAAPNVPPGFFSWSIPVNTEAAGDFLFPGIEIAAG